MQKKRKLITFSRSNDFFLNSKKHHIRAAFRIASFVVLFAVATLVKLKTDYTSKRYASEVQLRREDKKSVHRNLQMIKIKINMEVDDSTSTKNDFKHGDTTSPENATANESGHSSLVHELIHINGSEESSSIHQSSSVRTLNASELNATAPYAETNTVPSCSLKVANPKSMLLGYILGVLYMFIAIAIICDELFVPALEILASEKYLNLSMDVAGATLMAAGGSAPELFTSIIGTFQESEIGFGTIVGSAVFNVLFVIAMCSFFSRETLQLTWWPLLRDCTWYSFGLMTLAIWCGLVSPGRIEIWEAILQFSIYIAYVVFMKYNENIYQWISSKIKKKDGDDSAEVNGAPPRCHRASMNFQAGFCKLFVGRGTIGDRVRDCMVIQMFGDVDTVFSTIDENKDGLLTKDELRKILLSYDCKQCDEGLNSIIEEMSPDNGDKIDLNAFKKWYIKSEFGIKEDLEKIFNQFDDNGDNLLDPNEFKKLVVSLGSKKYPTQDQINDAFKNISNGDDEDKNPKKLLTYKQFEEWYFDSPFWTEQEAKVVEAHEEEEEVGIISDNLTPPERGSSVLDYIRWIIALPIIFCLSFTVPDVRKRGREKYAIYTFFLSICWIGVTTYFMVSWTEIIGNTLGIPMLIMGLTFLAAGTSVPDLLTSVIVARMGEGDMAVSSSIGSNIFDICFGLPIPWLLYSLAQLARNNPAYVTIGTDGMGVSILILLVMVIIVILIIHFSGWQLTKRVGSLMLVLYAFFLIQAIARELPFESCTS